LVGSFFTDKDYIKVNVLKNESYWKKQGLFNEKLKKLLLWYKKHKNSVDKFKKKITIQLLKNK
jgi:dTDP-D-glucose 4,6-dehydratase